MTEKFHLATLPVAAAEALKSKLALAGIDIALIHNEQSCKSGCAVQVEVWSHPDDVAEIARIAEAERSAHYQEVGYDPSLANSVFDPSREEATCPACGTNFATTLTSCPDCGLSFGVE